MLSEIWTNFHGMPNIRIYDNAFTKGGTTFEKGMNYNTEEDYELTGGDRVFNVKEIEVYEVIAS